MKIKNNCGLKGDPLARQAFEKTLCEFTHSIVSRNAHEEQTGSRVTLLFSLFFCPTSTTPESYSGVTKRECQ